MADAARQRELRARRKTAKAALERRQRKEAQHLQDSLAASERRIRAALATGQVGAAFWELCTAFGGLGGAHGAAHDGLVRLFERMRPYMRDALPPGVAVSMVTGGEPAPAAHAPLSADEAARDCRCAGPLYDPDKPCPIHPKVTAL
jgi:hypothetical protein